MTEKLPDILKQIEPKMSESNVEIITHQKWLDIWHMNISMNTRRANDMWNTLVSMKVFKQINRTSFRVDYERITDLITNSNIGYSDEESEIDVEGMNDAKRLGLVH